MVAGGVVYYGLSASSLFRGHSQDTRKNNAIKLAYRYSKSSSIVNSVVGSVLDDVLRIRTISDEARHVCDA